MTASRLRAVPSVDRLLRELGDTGLPRPIVIEAVRRELRLLRRGPSIPDLEGVLGIVRGVLARLQSSRIQPIINGTGILVHTNFGRAPLAAAAVERLMLVASQYNTLEYGLADGVRGPRMAYLDHSLAVLSAAGAAMVVNNNAAALVLLLKHFCRGERNEVVISRGELIQIGGGFRIPEILESSGARLREVGTTNHTSADDYAHALTRQTALILRVHRSNFFMDGFVASPPIEAVAAIARQRRVPLIEDLGSGAMFDTSAIVGLEPEPTPAAVLRKGVDVVCFSGDKLLGGPQAGIVAGRRTVIAALKREPLFRALRCDKLTLAALEATVDLHLHGGAGVPVVDMLRLEVAALRPRAGAIVAALDGLPMTATVGNGRAQIGGGALPRSALASVTIDLTHHSLAPQELARRLRQQPVPVIGYVARGVLKLDLRTIFESQDAAVVEAIRGAAG